MEQVPVTESVVKRSRQRSRQEIFNAIEEFDKATISPKEFAAMHQISEATFYNWRKKYRTRNAIKNVPKGFFSVSITPEITDPIGPGLFAQVEGKAIMFYQRVEPSFLKKLLS